MPQDQKDFRFADGDPVLDNVPVPLRVAAAWSWRLIVIGVVIVALLALTARVGSLVVPMYIALIIAAPLGGVVSWLARWVPRWLAALVTILSLAAALFWLLFVAGAQLVAGLGELRDKAIAGLRSFIDWIADGPLSIDRASIDSYIDDLAQTARENSGQIVSGAWTVTNTVGSLFAGTVIALFALFFFLKDGSHMWAATVRVFPEKVRGNVEYAGRESWGVLENYAKTSVTVAAIDAIGIGLGAWIIGVPLALPLAIVVFVTSFIPMFGALISGSIAVLVAFVDGDWKKALVMLAIVVAVQLIEGNLLYPWLFGRATSMHPLVILLTISIGTIFAGLAGALLAVPTLAFIKTFIGGLRKSGVGPTQAIPVVNPAPRSASSRRARGLARSDASDD